MNPIKWKLHWQIVAALGLALIISVILKGASLEGSVFAERLLSTCEFIGKLFMNALKMIIVPLIVSSIICGIMGLGSKGNFRRMGIKILLYYSVTGLLAIIVGLLIVNTIKPGAVEPELAEQILGQAQQPVEFMHKDRRQEHNRHGQYFFAHGPP